MIETNKHNQPHVSAKGSVRASQREKKLAEALRKNLIRRRKKKLSAPLDKKLTVD